MTVQHRSKKNCHRYSINLSFDEWISAYRKIPLLGQHSKRLVTMAWSKDNLLATGGEDSRMLVMSSNGTVLQQSDTNDVPRNLMFSEMKREKRGTYQESTVIKCTSFSFSSDRLARCYSFRLAPSSEKRTLLCGTWVMQFLEQRQLLVKTFLLSTFMINTETLLTIDGDLRCWNDF